MTPNQKLKAEVAHTQTVLRDAAERLLQWAEILASDFFKSSLPPEEVRQVSHVLAKQDVRLEMARELATRK